MIREVQSALIRAGKDVVAGYSGRFAECIDEMAGEIKRLQPVIKADAEKPCSFNHDKLIKHGSNYCSQCGVYIRTA